MIPTAPQIGFDRFIQLDWVAAALKVRAGVASLDELNELLDAAGLRRPPTTVQDDRAVAWLIEAALRYSGKAVSVASLPAMAVIFPFVLDRPLGYVASNSPMLELRSEGAGHQSVALASAV
jgi:hypothetical protein